jgi:hypothetical protein
MQPKTYNPSGAVPDTVQQLKLTASETRRIKRLISRFDFQTVHQVISDSGLIFGETGEPPTIEMLKDVARACLREALHDSGIFEREPFMTDTAFFGPNEAVNI